MNSASNEGKFLGVTANYAPSSFPTAVFRTLAGTGPPILKISKYFFKILFEMHCAVFCLVFITGLGMEIGPRQPECQRNAQVQSMSNPAVS